MSGLCLCVLIHQEIRGARAGRAFGGRMIDGSGREIREQLKHATRAFWFAIEQHHRARFERFHAKVIRTFAVRALHAIEKRGEVEHLGAMLEEVAIDDRAGFEFRSRL